MANVGRQQLWIDSCGALRRARTGVIDRLLRPALLILLVLVAAALSQSLLPAQSDLATQSAPSPQSSPASASLPATQPVASRPAPRVLARDPLSPAAKLADIQITDVRIETKVIATLVETSVTMTLFNPNDSPWQGIEGDLHFPLPPGAVVNGYGLDINGQMVDGVAVDKGEATAVFEEIEIIKRRDPGLVEQTGTNEFRTRVFPILPHGSRQIMIRYMYEMPTEGQTGLLAMPLSFGQQLHEFSIDVEVSGSSGQPTVRDGSPVEMELAKSGDGYHAQARRKDCSLAGDLQIDVPLPLQMAKAEMSDVPTTAPSPWYFCVLDIPPKLEQRRLAPPKTVTILWDASGQRGLVDHAKELDVLRQFFGTMRDRTLDVELVLLHNTPQRPLHFQVKNGDVTALLAELNRVAYDGAAGLATIASVPARVSTSKKIGDSSGLPDLYLLFSDGHLRFGSPQAADLKKPMYVFSAGPSPDEDVLGRLAAQSGGSYFNLVKGAVARRPRPSASCRCVCGQVLAAGRGKWR